MNRLLIVSNRLPISIVKTDNKLDFKRSVGGLATGLSSFYKSYESLWIGWPGITLEEIEGKENEINARLKSEGCYPVYISQQDIESYYEGFCNKTVWPLFHYFTQHTKYDEVTWKRYKQVNKEFFDAIMKVIEPGDAIWVHDYHLMLLPKLIREEIPDATIGFFLHIPFPSFEVFRLLPWRKEILNGLLGADLIGFHTFDYVRHFNSSVGRLLGYESTFGQITVDNRVIKVDTFPMGIDYERFANAVLESEVQEEIKQIRNEVGERKIIFSIDRLDYTKGILKRLESFDLFLDKNPEYEEKVTLILVAVPSRTGVEEYELLKKQLDELIGRINGQHGKIGWVPVWYLYQFLPFRILVALYYLADVALITPLRDGMNLIAKEFVATKIDGNRAKKGVLILSEMAGAARELGEALIINPNDKEEIANALKEALTIPEEVQIENNTMMQERLRRYTVVRWAEEFMEGLSAIKRIQQELYGTKLTYERKKKLIDKYLKSNKRLILLDYDGTLVPFVKKPTKANPDAELLETLKSLNQNPKNTLVIISGRDKEILEKWFSTLKLEMIAEHGVWLKEKESTWQMIEPLRNDWKDEIRPLLELYVDRTPGALIEEKDFSLAWHYRRVDPELALIRAGELKAALLDLLANLNVAFLEGNKVIEIKNVGINKGKAALNWISKDTWNLILAIGDDVTDEDIFAVIPKSGYSIKVGLGPSHAKFSVKSFREVRSLLKELEAIESGKK
ncbi:MAG: bifunctional alpha,alpha-trehalose-phosphate synthase (UDP-forming)/trehalose-phosphatase [Promethearchaeota archaeon]